MKPRHPNFDEFFNEYKWMLLSVDTKLRKKIYKMTSRRLEPGYFLGYLTIRLNEVLYKWNPKKGKFSSTFLFKVESNALKNCYDDGPNYCKSRCDGYQHSNCNLDSYMIGDNNDDGFWSHVKSLKMREQEILYHSFVNCIDDVMIGELLGASRHAIQNAKRRAIGKLQQTYCELQDG